MDVPWRSSFPASFCSVRVPGVRESDENRTVVRTGPATREYGHATHQRVTCRSSLRDVRVPRQTKGFKVNVATELGVRRAESDWTSRQTCGPKRHRYVTGTSLLTRRVRPHSSMPFELRRS